MTDGQISRNGLLEAVTGRGLCSASGPPGRIVTAP